MNNVWRNVCSNYTPAHYYRDINWYFLYFKKETKEFDKWKSMRS